jgi:uncharacterized repeat protein (TIGR03803 family)
MPIQSPRHLRGEARRASKSTLGICAAVLGFCLSATWPGTAPAASKLSVIYSFLGLSDGARVFDNPLLKDAKLYVTATYGGYVTVSPFSPGYGGGTIDEFVPPATPGGEWVITTLYQFKGDKDGSQPYARITEGRENVFFGTTLHGGDGNASPGTGDGTVFRLAPPAPGEKAWHETVLHVFGDTGDGSVPATSVIVGRDGSLYGTTLSGGIKSCEAVGCGVIYRLKPPAAGRKEWKETVIYRFHGTADGYYPLGDLISDGGEGFFGTTTWGGVGCGDFGCGTVFHLTPPRPGETLWRKVIIHHFGGGAAGQAPAGRLLRDEQGQLYGTTSAGGHGSCASEDGGCGLAFRLLPPAAAHPTWKYEVLHVFAGGKDGAIPYAGLTEVPNTRTFYGTTAAGGGGQCTPYQGCGTIYRLTVSDTGWQEKILFSFGEPLVGGTPFGGVALGGDNRTLYGATARLGSKTNSPCRQQGCGKLYELHAEP